MTVFGNSTLGRVGYGIMILLMLAFDYAKSPIERYLVRQHDLVAEKLMTPRPVVDAASDETGKINGREMPFMLKAHEDIIRDLAKSGRRMSKAELEAEVEKRLRSVSPLSILSMETNKPVPREIRELESRRSALAAAYPMAVLAMTAIVIVTLLWMVSSRLRDIGWPQYYLWILLAPVFLPRFLAIPLAPMAAQGLNLLFHAGVVFLALIPSEGDRPEPPAAPVALRANSAAVAAPRRTGRFGRLGGG
jgi:hypothetical protein